MAISKRNLDGKDSVMKLQAKITGSSLLYYCFIHEIVGLEVIAIDPDFDGKFEVIATQHAIASYN